MIGHLVLLDNVKSIRYAFGIMDGIRFLVGPVVELILVWFCGYVIGHKIEVEGVVFVVAAAVAVAVTIIDIEIWIWIIRSILSGEQLWLSTQCSLILPRLGFQSFYSEVISSRYTHLFSTKVTERDFDFCFK